MEKKYELTAECKEYEGRKLYRIRATKMIPKFGVRVGDLGGWIESEYNLSQNGRAWVGGEAYVYGEAKIWDEGLVYDNAKVYGAAKVG